MSNTNCLEGIKCPKCASLEPFRLSATTIVKVYDEGTDRTEDFDWDGNFCECGQCGYSSELWEFQNVSAPQSKPPLLTSIVSFRCLVDSMVRCAGAPDAIAEMMKDITTFRAQIYVPRDCKEARGVFHDLSAKYNCDIPLVCILSDKDWMILSNSNTQDHPERISFAAKSTWTVLTKNGVKTLGDIFDSFTKGEEDGKT